MVYCFAGIPSFFCSKSEIDRITVSQSYFLPISFLYARKLVFWHTWLRKLAKRQVIAQSSKMIPKRRKLFRKINHFSSTYSPQSAISRYKNLKNSFRLKALLFSSQSPKNVETLFNISKNVFPQNLLKVCRLQF